MRRVVLALALFTTACGSPVVGETTSPPGEIVDAAADPEAHARCVLTQAEEMSQLADGRCFCRTICPSGLEGLLGRCVPPEEARAMGFPGSRGACPAVTASQVRETCDVPDWPLYRCDLGRL